jgi:hypothetical protein
MHYTNSIDEAEPVSISEYQRGMAVEMARKEATVAHGRCSCLVSPRDFHKQSLTCRGTQLRAHRPTLALVVQDNSCISIAAPASCGGLPFRWPNRRLVPVPCRRHGPIH